jgi:hypothetical protein
MGNQVEVGYPMPRMKSTKDQREAGEAAEWNFYFCGGGIARANSRPANHLLEITI